MTACAPTRNPDAVLLIPAYTGRRSAFQTLDALPMIEGDRGQIVDVADLLLDHVKDTADAVIGFRVAFGGVLFSGLLHVGAEFEASCKGLKAFVNRHGFFQYS
jgi:hypothetical protein